MGAGYFLIAILGCGDGSSACTPVMTAPTHYASEAECAEATGAELIAHSDLDYPTIVARCRGVPAMNVASVKASHSRQLALRN